MPNINKQYKNLASKGRYGDTMLAHINPQEAGLLRAMGGAGTINPRTGLPEFYGMGQYQFLPKFTPEPLPVLAQAFNPDEFKNIPDKLPTTTIPAEVGFRGGGRPAYEKINAEFDQYADKDLSNFRSGAKITGYTVPTDKTFQDKPLVAKYDATGNFIHLTLSPESYLTPDPNQPNIIAQPTFNKTGGITNYGAYDRNNQDDGGFFSSIGELAQEFGPMILAGLGANFAAGNLSGLLGGGGAAAGGNAGALINAGMGGTAAQAASAASNLAATSAGLEAAIAAGGGLVPGVTANFMSPSVISGAGGATPAANLGLTAGGQDIAQLQQQLANTPMPEVTSGPPIAGEAVPGSLPEIAAESTASASDIAANDALAQANRTAQAAGGFNPAVGAGLLDSLGGVGTAIMDFAKANPSIAGSLIGAVTGAVGAANAPKSTTTTASIDPELKAEYLANIARAKETAAGLGVRQFEGFTPDYLRAENQVTNLGLGGKGQQTTDEAARLAMIEAGFTPQQIQAAQANRQNIQNASGQLGSQYMGAYQNPFEEQVVQGALGDIERSRQMQEQANRAQATAARAFGGSRQGVVSGMTNEAALRQAATTGGQLRQAGFNAAAQLGQSDAARQLQAQMANQGIDLTIEQANAQLRQQAALANQGAFAQGAGIRQAAIGQLGQLGAQQQNLGLTGANAVMEAQMRQQALRQAQLDAQRNIGLERLGITSGALGLGIPNLGGSTSQPLYSSTAGGALSGGLTGGYIGSLLGGVPTQKPYKPGDFIQGP